MESVQSNLPADALDASVSAEGDAIVVSLRGEADRFTLPVVGQVLERVIADHDGSVVIDLTKLASIETGIIRVVARAAALLGDRGRELTLRSPSHLAGRAPALVAHSDLLEPTKVPAS